MGTHISHADTGTRTLLPANVLMFCDALWKKKAAVPNIIKTLTKRNGTAKIAQGGNASDRLPKCSSNGFATNPIMIRKFRIGESTRSDLNSPGDNSAQS